MIENSLKCNFDLKMDSVGDRRSRKCETDENLGQSVRFLRCQRLSELILAEERNSDHDMK